MFAIATRVLTQIGALLGVVAFVQNILKPFASGNKNRWQCLRDILNEQDLTSMARSLSERQVLDDVHLAKLRAFALGIEENAEFVRFRGPFAGMIRRSLKRALDQYREWIRIVDVEWFRSRIAATRDNRKKWYVDKTVLEAALSVSRQENRPMDVSAAASEFGHKAAAPLIQMRAHLHRVCELANREVIEYLAFWNWHWPYATGFGLAALAIFLALGWLPSEVATSASAPGVLSGRRFVYNAVAYDCRIPFAHISLFRWGSPKPGDLVVVSLAPAQGGCKVLVRVVGTPGDTVEVLRDSIWINGRVLKYESMAREAYSVVPLKNKIGSEVASVKGLGPDHLITYTPGQSGDRAIRVTADHYYVLADNRDEGVDSRTCGVGAVARSDVLGKYVGQLP